MPEPIQDTPEVKEAKEAVEKYKKNINTRSLKQIMTDAVKPKEEEKVPDKIKEDKTDLEKKAAEEATKRKDEKVKSKEDSRKKELEETAKKTAEETANKVKEDFKVEMTKILEKDKPDIEKQKEADELVASWDKEKRLPKDYKELISETMRIADKRSEIKMREILEKQTKNAEAAKQKAVSEETAKRESVQKAMEAENSSNVNKLYQDIETLIMAGVFEKPDDIKNIEDVKTTDKNAQKIQEVLKFGIELNTKLKAEGKDPVPSFSRIYFDHYKPAHAADKPNVPVNDQPPGGDAPIAGSKNTPTGEADPNSMTPQKVAMLRHETWPQTLARIARESRARASNR